MKQIFLNILAILLLLEEWLWDTLSALAHFLIALLRLQAVERWLSNCNPATALVAILVPILLVTPINLMAFWFLVHGQAVMFLLLEALAKLLGTLLIARVFALTKPQLLSFSGINFLYTTIRSWLNWAHAIITATAVYRLAKQFKLDLKIRIKRIFGTV